MKISFVKELLKTDLDKILIVDQLREYFKIEMD